MTRWRRPLTISLAMSLIAGAMLWAPASVYAYPCLVDGGTINAKDSGAAGYPGSDAPAPEKWWGPDDAWHDQYLYEWCESAHDWMKDRYIRWNAAAVTWMKDHWNQDAWHMVFEQIIANDQQYNARSNVDSDLPYRVYYVADIGQQIAQHYEEAGFWMFDGVLQLVAGKSYYAYAQWDQEKSPMDAGFSEFSSQAEEVNRFSFDVDGVDSVGKMTGKHWNQ